MTKKEVSNLLMVIAMTYPNSKLASGQQNLVDMVTAWHIFLEDKDTDGISLALKSFVSTHGSAFPPSVAEIIEEYNKIIEKVETEEIGEMQAWHLCYDAICRSGGDDRRNSERAFASLPEIIQDTIGNPGNLREMAIDPKFNEGVERSNFLRNYQRQLERRTENRRILPEVKALMEERMQKSLVTDFDIPRYIESTERAEQREITTCEESEENRKKVKEMIERMRNGAK